MHMRKKAYERRTTMHMRKKAAITTIIICSILEAGVSVSADVKSMPSPTLVSAVAGKTFEGKISGYGWGQEDDPASLSIDFTVVEPIIYEAAEIESLTAGDMIIAGYESYTVSSVEQDGKSIIVTPAEEWFTPITFTACDDGTYSAENEEGVLKSDSFSFAGRLRPDLVYVNGKGEQLTAAELLKDISGEVFDTYSTFVKITFDENGYIVELDVDTP